jgi:hypothetical protein
LVRDVLAFFCYLLRLHGLVLIETLIGHQEVVLQGVDSGQPDPVLGVADIEYICFFQTVQGLIGVSEMEFSDT